MLGHTQGGPDHSTKGRTGPRVVGPNFASQLVNMNLSVHFTLVIREKSRLKHIVICLIKFAHFEAMQLIANHCIRGRYLFQILACITHPIVAVKFWGGLRASFRAIFSLPLLQQFRPITSSQTLAASCGDTFRLLWLLVFHLIKSHP